MIEVKTVMAGQVITVRGVETVSIRDSVILSVILDGHSGATGYLSPGQALETARALSAAAGTLVNAERDDAGKPLSLLARLARLRGTR